MSIEDNLSDIPSVMLQQALDDLKKCEKDPAYEVSMGRWHDLTGDVCKVCLAGAALSKSCNAPLDYQLIGCEDRGIVGMDKKLMAKIRAIDYFRTGEIWLASGYLWRAGIISPVIKTRLEIPELISITPYSCDRNSFIADIGNVILRLKEAGC